MRKFLRIHRLVRTSLVTSLAVVLLPLSTGGTAHASTPPSTSILVGVADKVTDPAQALAALKAGASPAALGITKYPSVLNAEQSRLLGPEEMRKAASYAPAEEVDSPQSPTASNAISPRVVRQPARSLTQAECVAHDPEATGKMWLKSRFAICQSIDIVWVWLIDGEPVGYSQVIATQIGTVPDPKSRYIQLDYTFSHFAATGTNAFDEVLIGTDTEHDVEFPKTAQILWQGQIPGPESIAWWKLHPRWTTRLIVPVGEGYKPDDVVWGLWNVTFPWVAPPGWITTSPSAGSFTSFGVRWDNAPYLPNYIGSAIPTSGGAEFSYDTDPLVYSKAAGSPDQAAALHIWQAFTKPGTTYPPNAKKKVPGQTIDAPLSRLYYDTARRNANRAAAQSACRKYDPNFRRPGLDCDEYPFSATYQGCAQHQYDSKAPINNYSAKMINSAQNQMAGNELGQFYNNERIIDYYGEDGFTVQIIG